MRTLCVAVALSLTALAGRADACTCMLSGPPCQNYFEVDAVFVGVARTLTQSPSGEASERPVAAFTVERAFRGIASSTVNIVGGNGADCGYAFKAGERYLVYASRDKQGQLQASICSRTRPISEAYEDLRYLEALPASGTGARVYGWINHWERDFASGSSRDYGPVSSVHVVLRGKTGALEARTDDRGRYEIAGVPPGSYELQAIPPAPYSTTSLQSEIEIRDARACAVRDFSVRYDGRVSGTIVRDDGQPAAGLIVEMRAAERGESFGPVESDTVNTDAGGNFEFTDVSPGTYVVGVELQRRIEADVVYPKTFYPGTRTLTDAKAFTIGGGTRRSLGTLRLPPERRARDVTGVVAWSDGRPVNGASVYLAAADGSRRQVAVGVRTRVDGTFAFTVHDGLSYVARAFYNVPDDTQGRQVQGQSDPFVATANLPAIRIVLATPDRRRSRSAPVFARPRKPFE